MSGSKGFAPTLALLAMFVGCGYSGDGEYSTEGIFPLRNYSIAFPAIPLDNARAHSFQFRGYGGKKARVSLVLRSPRPISFFELSTVIDFRITDRAGNTLFRKVGPLDGHHQRMLREGDTSWPDANEWMTEYEWADEEIAAQAVAFNVDQTPLDQDKCTLWSLEETEIDRGHHVVELTVSEVDAGYRGVTAEVLLGTGWK